MHHLRVHDPLKLISIFEIFVHYRASYPKAAYHRTIVDNDEARRAAKN